MKSYRTRVSNIIQDESNIYFDGDNHHHFTQTGSMGKLKSQSMGEMRFDTLD